MALVACAKCDTRPWALDKTSCRRALLSGRLVAETPAVAAQFDVGVAGLDERLRSDAEADAFVEAFDDFLGRFGSRGPNEWESACEVWGTDPSMPLAARVEAFERSLCKDALERARFNQREAADLLGITYEQASKKDRQKKKSPSTKHEIHHRQSEEAEIF